MPKIVTEEVRDVDAADGKVRALTFIKAPKQPVRVEAQLHVTRDDGNEFYVRESANIAEVLPSARRAAFLADLRAIYRALAAKKGY